MTVCDIREGAAKIPDQHRELCPLVEEAAVRLRDIFGAPSELALERFNDPEAPAEEPRLFLLVKTRLHADAALAMLVRFDETWWLANSHRGMHLLQVSLEFV